MEPMSEPLTMYGGPAGVGGLEWQWVEKQLVGAPAYWVVTPATGHPHPRPVWGIWRAGQLSLSIGSPRIAADVEERVPVTVHLGSVTDVVIVEGTAAGAVEDQQLLEAYNAKYDWDYTVAEYGPFTRIEPHKAMAWRSGGWGGREGFQQAGRWRWPARHLTEPD